MLHFGQYTNRYGNMFNTDGKKTKSSPWQQVHGSNSNSTEGSQGIDHIDYIATVVKKQHSKENNHENLGRRRNGEREGE